MSKNKTYKKLFSFIFMILFLLFFQTIVYSAFSSTMNITGIAHSRVESDVRITDFRLASTNNATSLYEEFGKNHITTNANFTSSTSSITYYLEITNYGSTDVGIFAITDLPNEVNYSIKDYNLHDKICDDAGNCNSFIKKTYEITLSTTSTYSGNIKMNFDFRTYHKVIYTDIENNNYPTEVIDGGNLSITFTENLKKVSILSNEVEINYYEQISSGQTIIIENISNDIEIKKAKELVAKLVSGSIYTVGSEVCIKDECFYIISNNGSTVTMLSKINITTEAIPKQSINAPTISFSSSSYWGSVSKGTYVYDSNSLIYNHVENYKTYLESQGINIQEIRLINKKELELLGCSGNSCSSAPSWVYATSYWSGAANGTSSILRVANDMTFGANSFSFSTRFGIRPIVSIDINDICLERDFEIISGDINTLGSEICIKDECFYLIKNNGSTVTMLAKYNLYVGGSYNVETGIWTAYGEEATGIQNPAMTGFKNDLTEIPGTIEYSSSGYWIDYDNLELKPQYGTQLPAYIYDSNSLIYPYIENYKTYLESQGVTVEEARLLNKDDLKTLGCNLEEMYCNSSPNWLYSTSTWTGVSETYAIENLFGIFRSEVEEIEEEMGMGTITYYFNTDVGVRPVIVLNI